MTVISIDQAKKKLSFVALAQAIMQRAEAAGQSVTEWMADEQHAAECSAACTSDTCKKGDECLNLSPESKK